VWPFSSRQHQESPGNHQETSETHQEPVRATIAGVLDQISQLRAEVAGLQQEWGETLDRLNRMVKRFSARERKQLHSALEEEGPEVAEENGAQPAAEGAEDGTQDARSRLKAQLRSRLQQRGTR
jgi:hypothetical protein